ncbi:helix-turn-helix domain containing protein [Aneurinibacillus sp. Ricciae_BoGa-3]|uniref:TetR/AcrR family transcriptional regulator n=1 Tax=Aneurinibacillus sp. Ricciae_BoGa-3 TaxID=3022697 RepID=UPI002341CC78|nr:TetR/AcrR family transcriptional regulator [Aneurinibacillus sp. Ricciae_BoGa-3]WCK52392.1 helix-turn-helix domain containing protein [Aneurinibacillus sp. Ricciae_BoGa-3]
MNEKNTEKKKFILKTAMKLFSVKNYQQTSMKEIADACEMSKGSLYLYFKSKEELFLTILQHYFRLIEDQAVLIDRNAGLSAKEKFMKQIEIRLSHYIEFREFYMVQMRQIPGLMDKSINAYIQQKNVSEMKWLENSLTNLYGAKLSPYIADCSLLLMGMTASYMKLIMVKQVPLAVDRVTRFIVKQLECLIEGFLREDTKPLVSMEIWKVYEEDTPPAEMHPLVILKKIKDFLANEPLSNTDREEAIQSLRILEHELMELEPRAVVIRGMLRNLESIPDLNSMCEKLSQALQLRY